MPYWDRNAPLPDESDRSYHLAARRSDIVLDAYAAFSPDMAAIGRRFFDNRWIDAPVAAGQVAGRLRASDRAERASLSAAQLSRQDARRDDAGA